MATHSSILAWRIPGMELHRVGDDWNDLAVAVKSTTTLEDKCKWEQEWVGRHACPCFPHPIWTLLCPWIYSSLSPAVYLLTSKRENKGSSRIDFAKFFEHTEHHFTIFCTLIWQSLPELSFLFIQGSEGKTKSKSYRHAPIKSKLSRWK